MTISISGQVPAEAQNGMTLLEAEWTREPTPDAIYAVVKIERAGLKFTDATQEWAATMKLTHIEPLTGDDAERAQAILRTAAGVRGGEILTELDFPSDEQTDADTETFESVITGGTVEVVHAGAALVEPDPDDE